MTEKYKSIAGSGGGKGGGDAPRVAKEAANTLRSIQYAKALDLVCEGEIEGLVNGLNSVYINGTPAQNEDGTDNFEGITLLTRNGTQAQTHIPGFGSITSTENVNTIVEQATPIIRTITESTMDRAIVTISIPRLTHQNTTNGDLNGSIVDFKFEVQADGGGYNDVYFGSKLYTGIEDNINSGESETLVTVNNNIDSLGAKFTVKWNRPVIATRQVWIYDEWGGQTKQTQEIYGGSYLKYILEYKTSISGTYTTYETKTLTCNSSKSDTRTIYRNITISDLPEDTYDFRLTVVSAGVVQVPTYIWAYDPDGYYNQYVNPISAGVVPTISISDFSSIVKDSTVRIQGKTVSLYKKDFSINLTGSAPWDIRLTRITPDSTSSALSNDLYFDAITKVIDSKLTYPNSALVGLSIDASQFNKIPTRGYDLKLLRVQIPTNYDPISREYDGVWDGTFQIAWTDNPAWCFYDLLLNDRYGMGQYLSATQIDKWQLYTLAQYCDELVPDGLGSVEPRLTFNVYLQTREEAYTVLQNLASVFRGMLYWSNNNLSTSFDHPTDTVAIFNNTNVIEGSFTYTGTGNNDRHNVVLVTWNDPNNLYKPAVEYVEDQQDIAARGRFQKEVVALGTTSRGQAQRFGRWILYTERRETEIATFKLGLDNLNIKPGDTIEIYDKYRAGIRFSGRITDSTLNSITIDSPVTLDSDTTYNLSLITTDPVTYTRADGTPVERKIGTIVEKVLSNSPGTTSILTFDIALSELLPSNTIWAIFEDNLNPQKFKVNSISEEDNLYEVLAIEHNDTKYDFIDSLGDLEFSKSQIATPLLNVISNVTLEEELYFSGPILKNRVSVAWDVTAISNILKYKVEYKKDDSNWIVLTDSASTNTAELSDATPGTYTFRVYTTNSLGLESYPEYSDETIIYGKTSPPEDVQNFNITIRDEDVLLTWDSVSDLDLADYILKTGTVWESGVLLANVRSSSYTLSNITAGSLNLMIKAKDTSENESLNINTISTTISAPDQPSLFVSNKDSEAIITWTSNKGSFLIEKYELRYGGSDWDSSIYLATVYGDSYLETVLYSGSRTYRVKAIDIFGNESTDDSAVNIITTGTVSNIVPKIIDNNVLLKWNNVLGNLPLNTVEVRKGTVFSSAEVIGTKAGTFTIIFESLGGQYTYWLVPIDTAGNYGTEQSVVVSVNEPPDYILKQNWTSSLDGTKVNITSDNYLSVDTTETWTDHFVDNSWTTPQNQITAGYTRYIEPSLNTSSYEEIFDYGALISVGTKITVDLSTTVFFGSITATPAVSVSTDDITYTTPVASWQLIETNFRYIKVSIAFSSADNNDVARINELTVRLDLKQKTDGSNGSAVSTDSGGTTVNFAVDFLDVESITVTPKGTSAVTAVYDFTDVPNPTSFSVYLFNSSGTRVSGDFSWVARGI